MMEMIMSRGIIDPDFRALRFGFTVKNTPLEVYLPNNSVPETNRLIMAGVHGEESETTILLSRVLRTILDNGKDLNIPTILCANPDGALSGTRSNANGVDLNRNFPSSDWSNSEVYSRWTLEDPRDVRYSAGIAPASEPETQSLIGLIQQLGVKQIISLHSPLGCIDAPANSKMAKVFSEKMDLPLVDGQDFETPGSLGTWANENGIEVITVEFPRESMEILSQRYLKFLCEFMQG